MFCNPGPQSKIGRTIGILLISKFGWGSTKTVVESRVLVRGIFNERKLVLGLQHVKVKVKVQMEKFRNIGVLP